MKAVIAVDSSVIIAIFKAEPEERMFQAVLLECMSIIGWPTVLETRVWILRRGGSEARNWLNDWLAKPSTKVVAFDADLERLAASAYDRFRKGRHQAALNFGDAMTYAVARHHHAPLLFKGNDFGQTDLLIHEASVTQA